MNKYFYGCVLAGVAVSSFAYFDYKPFQQYDNQIGFGMNAQNGNFSKTSSINNNPYTYDIVMLNLEVEKLFDIGLWLDVNTANVQSYTQSNFVNPLGSYPFIATLNAKVGYNIPFANFFALVPYLEFGKNANLNGFTSLTGGMQGQGVSQDFFYSPGLGLRFEFPINKYIQVFLDQAYQYHYDQSNVTPDGRTTAVIASNSQWTTTLGAKVNIVENLLLSANVFYVNYADYNQEALKFYNSSDSTSSIIGLPTTSLGIQGSIGFTFK